jgi:hypothetical protein
MSISNAANIPVGRRRSAPADRVVAFFFESAVHEILEHGVRVAGLQNPPRRPAGGPACGAGGGTAAQVSQNGARGRTDRTSYGRSAAGALGDFFTFVAGGFVVNGVFFSSFPLMSRYVSVTGLI